MTGRWAITEEDAAARDALVLAQVREAIVRFGLADSSVPDAVFFRRLRHFRHDAVLDAVGRALERQKQGAPR
jgi:hypothetical protein